MIDPAILPDTTWNLPAAATPADVAAYQTWADYGWISLDYIRSIAGDPNETVSPHPPGVVVLTKDDLLGMDCPLAPEPE